MKEKIQVNWEEEKIAYLQLCALHGIREFKFITSKTNEIEGRNYKAGPNMIIWNHKRIRKQLTGNQMKIKNVGIVISDKILNCKIPSHTSYIINK